MLIVTPDVSSPLARLMGRRWWHCRVAHVCYFDRRSMAAALARAGLVPVGQRWVGWRFPLPYLLERVGRLVPVPPVPAAMKWLAPGKKGRIVTLIKPHYEVGRPRLSDEEVDRVVRQTLDAMPTLGVRVVADAPSPIAGSKGRNREHLALLEPVAAR